WTRHQENAAKLPLKERTGRSLTETVSVSDLPVCGAKVGFADFYLDAAATPPRAEGSILSHSSTLSLSHSSHSRCRFTNFIDSQKSGQTHVPVPRENIPSLRLQNHHPYGTPCRPHDIHDDVVHHLRPAGGSFHHRHGFWRRTGHDLHR